MHFQDVFRAIHANHAYEYLIIDANLNIIEFSDMAYRFCDTASRLEVGMSVGSALPELFGMETQIISLLKRELPPIQIPYVLKEDATYINIRLHPGRHDHGSGQCETLIILFEDVTEMAHLEQKLMQDRNEKALLLQELEEKNAQLQRFNDHMQELVRSETKKSLEKQKMLELQSRHSQMGEMIGMITHQWKQPLGVITAIGGACKIKQVRGRITQEFYAEQIEEILHQVSFMQQTVEDFQQFFNPVKEKIFFNVKENIEKILALVQKEFELSKIEIKLIGDEHINVLGYPNEYNQVILSLLKNARDAFESQANENKKVLIDVRQVEGRSRVTVRDNAGGIAPEVMETLFDLYVTTKSTGSGLGLNIAKNVIESNMQGELRVRNVDGGAEFSIVL